MLDLSNVTLISAICSPNYMDDTIKSFRYNFQTAKFGAANLLFKDLNYNIYNRWFLKELVHSIKTDFALIVQWDSGIINPQLWTDDFFDYDYVGAPWQNDFPNRIGNGGFSLRSRKYIELCAQIADSAPIDSFIYQNEDFFCNVSAYNYMMENNIKYPSLEIARRFSVERSCKEFFVDVNNLSSYKSFGFHGDFNIAGMEKILRG